jgi:hypothetical protein
MKGVGLITTKLPNFDSSCPCLGFSRVWKTHKQRLLGQRLGERISNVYDECKPVIEGSKRIPPLQCKDVLTPNPNQTNVH